MNAQLDTYQIAQRLKGVGFSEEQAGLFAEVLRETREADAATVATKGDMLAVGRDVLDLVGKELRATESGLRTEIAGVRKEVEGVEGRLRSEFRGVEAVIRADIKSAVADLRTEMASNRVATMQWVVGLFVAQVVAVGGLFKLLMPTH